jgi:calcium-dependent protein kinase
MITFEELQEALI